MRYISVSALCASVCTFALAQPAFAQESGSSTQLEEIVVTAQKRAQNLQDVPIAVTAFSGESLEKSGVSSIRDLSQADSSLTLTFGAQTATSFVRGVGNPGSQTVGNEGSVAFYIDDVYYTRVSTPFLALANIDRVEVLKGPQGTLFGRNASGGLINIITRTPDMDKMVVEATAGYGNYDTWMAKLYASTPLGEKVGMDISVAAQNQSKGWGRNLFTGNRVWKDKYVSLRSKLVADLTETTRATLIGYYVESKTQIGFQYAIAQGSIGGEPAFYGDTTPRVQSDIGFYNINLNYDPYSHGKGWGGSLKLEQEMGFADLVSISAYRKGEDVGRYAGKNSIYPYLAYLLYAKDRQYSQEFQLKSKADSAVDWILGLYHMNSKAGYSPSRVFGDAFGPGSSGPDLGNPTLGAYLDIYGMQTIKSNSVFGQSTFKVLPETTNITLGLRYTIDKLRGRGEQFFTAGGVTFPFPAIAGGQDLYDEGFKFKKLTFKVAVDHKFSDDVLGYVSVSRGFKSGTFNTLPLDRAPTRPEVVTSYEAGLKTELLDRRLRLNFAVYQNDIKDLQVQVIRTVNGIGAVVLQNAATARTKGAELEGQAILAEGLSLRFGINYLDAKYRRFDDAPFFVQNPLPFYGNTQLAGDAKGNRLTQSPKWKTNLGFNYEIDTGLGEVNFTGNMAHTSKFYWGPDNNASQGSYTLFNASVGVNPTENVGVRFWANNITKEKYLSTVLIQALENGNTAGPAAPRTYGVEVSYKF